MATDGLRTDIQISGDLAVGHATDGFHENLGIKVGPLLPVGRTEGLSTEGALAVFAEKPGDTVGVAEGRVVADLLEGRAAGELCVVYAVRIGAVGR
jgi:hypothetical protein